MAEHTVIMENTLRKLLAEKKYATLREILITMNPADIAAIFDELEEDRLPLLYRLLPKELAADVFVEMDQEGSRADAARRCRISRRKGRPPRRASRRSGRTGRSAGGRWPTGRWRARRRASPRRRR